VVTKQDPLTRCEKVTSDFPSETFRVLKEREGNSSANTAPADWYWRAFDKLALTDRFRHKMAKRESSITLPAKPAKIDS
jgi:hypothetical protein